ncbi:hypothetical protein EBT25_00190 [bacterium]|nr:hypothetical protein [bacterium]
MAERTILDIAKALESYGLRAREHPALPGGVGKGHSPTGYHPTGEAVDITDWRPDVAPAFPGGKPIHWKQRTGELSWRAKQLGIFAEALGPGDKGHDTHVHLALPGKKFVTDQQIQWLATGRWPGPKGLTDVMPTLDQQTPQVQPSQQPAQSDLPQSINIVIQTGKKEEEQTPEQYLKNYIEKMSKPSGSVLPVNSLVKMMQSQPTTNYFA